MSWRREWFKTRSSDSKDDQVIDWGNLFTGFGFKFRSVVNMAVSGYLLAVALPQFGVGESGFTNIANVAHFLQFNELGDWIENIHTSICSDKPNKALIVVLFVWLVLICLALENQYKDKHKLRSNLMPNSAMSSAFIWALWTDLISSGKIANIALVAISITLAIIFIVVLIQYDDTLNRNGVWDRVKEAFLTVFAASPGILISFIYVVIAPPLWLAGSDSAKQTDAFERGFNAGRLASSDRCVRHVPEGEGECPVFVGGGVVGECVP